MANRKNFITLSIIMIIALLLLNAYLLYNKYKQDEIIAKQQIENTQLVDSKTEIERNYYEAMSELESLRTGNDSLNILIDQQQDELTNIRHRLLKMGNNEKDLKSALSDMRDQNDGFIARINKLMEENQYLNQALSRSEQERSAVKSALNSELDKSESLQGQVEDLTARKDQLERKESQLQQKVTAAKVVQAAKVSMTGLKIRKSGKEVSRDRASNLDKIEVCFHTTKNYAADIGTETFYVRIINPLGETLAVESMGSGVLEGAVTGEAIRYTRKFETEYEQKDKEICLDWTPESGVSSGRYEVQIYNKGYLAGKGSAVFK